MGKFKDQYEGVPYPFGVDPVWLTASNSISFLNGYKMKISLIFGVIHMTFGVLLSVWNKVNHRHYHSIILEFLPQVGVDHDHHDQPGDDHDKMIRFCGTKSTTGTTTPSSWSSSP